MLALTDAIWIVYRWGLRLFDPNHPVSLAIRAEEAMGRQQWGVAFDLSHSALRKRADFAPAFFLRALSRLHLDDYQGALHDLNRFLSLVDEPPGVVYYWRGWIYAHKEEWALALADFDRLLGESPDDPQLHYWRSYVFWQRQEWDKMGRSLERLEALTPSNPLAWELRGHLLLHEGAFEGAEEAYTRAMGGGWENPDLRYNRAVARRHLGRHQEARADIEAIFGMDPDNLWAHLELGNFAFAAANYDEALRHARAAITLDPTFFEARVSEAATLMAMEADSEARTCLEALRQDFPNEPLVEQLYGDLLAEADDGLAAIESYRAALRQEPDNHAVRVKLASELVGLEQYGEAETELATALAADPEFADAYAARADLYRVTNDPAAMRADLDRLLTLRPDDAWALAFRAAHRQWQGEIDGALADYGAALAADASEAWIWAFRGQLHLRRGNFRAARDDFQRAITLAPEDPWIRRQWAYLLFRCGHPTRAAEVLDCLLEDELEDGFARLFRADLHLLAGQEAEATRHLHHLITEAHELAWLAHAALAVLTEGEARAAHLAAADEERPEPRYWGITPATVLAQQSLVHWLRDEPEAAKSSLREAIAALEFGEMPWLALAPLFERLEAAPLLALLPAAPAREHDSVTATARQPAVTERRGR